MRFSRKETRGAATGGKRRASLRRLLVVAEIALSFILLVSAGLLIESIRQLGGVSPGFNPNNLLAATLSFPRSQEPGDYATEAGVAKAAEQTSRFLASVEQKISTLPGVESVGVINDLPGYRRGFGKW